MSDQGKMFEFGDFLFVPSESQLFKQGELRPLTQKALRILQILVLHHGRVVEKDWLLSEIWGEVAVEESAVARNVWLIREALGDDPREPVFIQTVPKRGYRFIGKLRELPIRQKIQDEKEGEAVHPGDSVRGESGPGPTKFRWKVIVAAASAVAMLALIVTSAFVWSARSGPKRTTIAVLPFVSLSSSYRDEIYELGLADAVISQLSSHDGIIVRPLNAVRKYTATGMDPLAAGIEQDVDYVIASTYQFADGKFRTTSVLFDVRERKAVSSVQSELGAVGTFAIQDAVASELTRRFAVKIPGVSGQGLIDRGTENEQAYRFFLQATILYDQRTSASAKRSAELLNEATRLDPNYALAWAWKARAHRYAAFVGNHVDVHEAYSRSAEAVRHALELDPNLSEAYAAACENKFTYEYDFAGAERDCRKAIDMGPNSSTAHEVYSRFLSSRGRHDEAIEHAKIAMDLEPASLFIRRGYALRHYAARRFDEALFHLNQVVERDPEYMAAYRWVFVILQMQGRHSEAFEWFMRSRPKDADGLQVAAYREAFHERGIAGLLSEAAWRKEDNLYFTAGHLAQIGDNDDAFLILEKMYERREWGIGFLEVEPRFDPLRADPRFEALLVRIGQK